MIGRLLLRGMLAGLLAGVLAFGVAKLYGEPPLSRSIAIEQGAEDSPGELTHLYEDNAPDTSQVHGGAVSTHEHEHEHEIVSREVQSTIGLFTGIVVYSISIGGIFALVFAYSLGRFGKMRPRRLSAILALAAFVAIVLIPALKYPPNPPPAGMLETIGKRTALFFLMLLVSIVAMATAMSRGRKFVVRYGRISGVIRTIFLYLIIVTFVGWQFPTIDEVPDDFSLSLLIEFRVASIAVQVVLWATLSLVFGLYAERALKSYDHKRGSLS